MIKRLIFKWAVATAAIATLASCASGNIAPFEVTKGTVIQNVTVVNTRDGSLRPGMSIVIDDGTIQRIAAIGSIRVSGTAQLVDVSGKYVVPGFLDMHTHSMFAADRQPPYWPLLIANGITGIREMAGSPELIQRARRLNADSAAGRIDAPEIVLIPGNLLTGVNSAAAAVQQVQRQKAIGADFIKLISANREATLAILAEAKNQGLSVAGHLPPAVSAVDASAAGWRAIEHFGAGLGILLDCADEEANVRRSVLNGEGAPPVFSPSAIISPMLNRALDAPFYQRVLNSYDGEKCQALAKIFAKNETWQVPTLIRLRTAECSDDQLFRSDPNLIYVDKTTKALWEQLAQQFSSNVPPAAAATFRQYYGMQQKLLKLLKQNGVKMLAGSDLGGIWIIPGFSLHQEFRELAASGLSPLEILQMTTLNGAEFLHREATMGTVDPGKNADLVLLDADPVADVANLDKISGVFLKGKYFSKENLENLKKGVADAYRNQPLKSLGSVIDRTHID